MAKMGRPDKYKTNVKPYLKEIKEMAMYMTEKQIAETLGVAYSSFRVYKKKHKDLVEALKKGRQELITDLRSILIKRAKGFTYEEKKVTKKNGVIVKEEIFTKASAPDVAAINLALKNYDADNWSNDPQAMKLKQEELELKKLKLESEDW